MICHLDITSIALHKDSEEAKQQIQREEGVFDGNLIFGILIVLHAKEILCNKSYDCTLAKKILFRRIRRIEDAQSVDESHQQEQSC